MEVRFSVVIVTDDEPLAVAELAADEAVAAGDFGFLADAEPAAGGDQLDDFFKGFS